MATHMRQLCRAAIATLAACAMTVPFVTCANAAEGTQYDSPAGYTATKISHPNSSVGENDGIVDVDGQPDVAQSYSWSAVGYGDWMYIGTCYGPITNTIKWVSSLPAFKNVGYDTLRAGVDALFNGTLYQNNLTDPNKAVILKINTKTGESKVVYDPYALGQNVSGFRAAIEFHDKLYFSAMYSRQPYVLEIDPANDSYQTVYQSPVLTPTAEDRAQGGIATGIRGLAVYNNQLIASTVRGDGGYIVASSDPSKGQDSFTDIATPAQLGNPKYHNNDSINGGSIWDIVPFNNRLYITTITGTATNPQGFALYRGEPDASGKWTYTPLAGNGGKYDYAFGASRSAAGNMVVYKNHLYLGGYNDPMRSLSDALDKDFGRIYQDLSHPVNLWRMDADENFELVAGSKEDAAKAGAAMPIAVGKNLDAGLGSNLNQYVWRMQSYDGKLYVGTFDMSSLAYPLGQFTNGDVLKMTPEEIKSQIEYIRKFIETLRKNSDSEAQQNDVAASTQSDRSGKKAVVTDEGNAKDTDAGTNDADVQQLEQFEQLMGDVSSDLSKSQTDLDDGAQTLSADDTYTLKDRENFEDSLRELYKVYQKVRPMLPANVRDQLDKWLTEKNVNNFADFVGVLRYLSTSQRGFDLLSTSNGVKFDAITRDGFGDPYNHGLRTFAITDSGLSIGTANPFKGTQVWNLTDTSRGAVTSAELSNGNAFIYDKYDASAKAQNKAGQQIGITFHGNTVSSVQYDYQTLTEGTDYVVNENGITLTSAFLNGKKTGSTGSVVVFFNRGARARCTVTIKDSTPGAKPAQPATPVKPATKSDAKTDAQRNGTASTANTGASVALIAIAAMLLVAAGGVMLARRRSK